MSKQVFLLDANVLIALTSSEHVSHQKVLAWFRQSGALAATCPITEGGLVRFHVRLDPVAGWQLAQGILVAMAKQAWHRFWADDVSFQALPHRGLRGHKQVTDLYLVELAKAHGGLVATLDQALAAWHPDGCLLVK